MIQTLFKVLLFPFRLVHSFLSICVIAGVAIVFTPLFVVLASISVKYIYWIQKVWSYCFIFICGGRLKISGQENIPETGAVYLFNHSSFLDIPTLVLGTERFVFYVAKKELGAIPFVGWCIRAAGTLMMPRRDLNASVALYAQAKKRLEKGEQFMIAPEGTRHRGQGIGPFKSGPFYFAMSCQADLVPVIITGTKELWPAKDLTPNLRRMTNRIHIRFYPKISTKDWNEDNRKEKMAEVREFFVQELEKNSI